MHRFTAYVTGSDGTLHRLDLTAADLQAARDAARQIGQQLFGRGFTYSVRAA
ncbi:MAG: hypothetical protein RJA36_35 [Pseudomonadota bacterium]|jgi:hypothetical protein